MRGLGLLAVGLVTLVASGAALGAAAAAPTAITGSVTSVDANSATLNATVNPSGKSTSWYFEYGTSTSYGTKTPSQDAGSGTSNLSLAAAIGGLSPGKTYHYRVVATNGDGTAKGTDGIFSTTGGAAEPTVVTGAASEIGPKKAVLNGTVNPRGQATTYYFEYGPSAGYGTKTSTTSAGSGTSTTSVAKTISGLDPGREYHYRLVATNASGTSAGADQTFRADPSAVVTTEDATSVGARSATLNGSINAFGRGTDYYFEYGTSTKYGSRTSKRAAGAPSQATRYSRDVTGLKRGRTYHFRLVAVNGAGTVRGEDRTFTTLSGPTVVTGPATAVGATAATVSGTVNPNGRSTSYYVEYGRSTSYGSRTSSRGIGSGTNDVGVTAGLGGLAPGVVYHYRLVAANGDGTTRGNDLTLATSGLPTARTGPVLRVGLTSAVLTGVVNPSGVASTAYFEYGRTLGYGRRTPVVGLGAGSGNKRVQAQLRGLRPGVRYLFRVVVSSSAGTTVSNAASFGTPPVPRDSQGRRVRCTISGTQTPDVLRGTPRRDVICGLGGNDRLIGFGGNDVLVGGPGDDILDAGAGKDELHGGPGRDQLYGRSGNDGLFGGTGNDRLFGAAGVDRLIGSSGNDVLLGGGGSDAMLGGGGSDTFFARDGRRDIVDGGPGRDTATIDRGLDRLRSIERRR
jgi:phosphodiesterase/alkaline phosphatase D-like protein